MTRNEEIVSEVVKGRSFTSVGRSYGLTTERIRQIAVSHGVKSAHRREPLSPDKIARAVTLFKRGMPIAHIAEDIDACAKTVVNHLGLLKLYTPERRDFVAWDDAKDALLRKHYNSYPGAAQMLADQFGTTRNAIIGRANRLGLQKASA